VSAFVGQSASAALRLCPGAPASEVTRSTQQADVIEPGAQPILFNLQVIAGRQGSGWFGRTYVA